MAYQADLRDLKFQLLEWIPLDELLAADRFADWDRENVEMVLDEALTLAEEQLATINQDGDRTGVELKDGRVTVPPSFKPAFETFREGGWIGCTSPPEIGGLGLPEVVGTAVNELFSGANLSFTVMNLLTRGAAHLIAKHGGDELRETYCERMLAGEWSGTMCLTEARAGSDVGASTTRALRQEDGSYLISGEKIFITSGEHDLTRNIIHTVLARIPEAPAGTRGLSLFAVPKIRVASDGSLGAANDVRCVGVEHKLGIHASPTCTILFGAEGGCRGEVLGEEGQGMQLMFEMMNEARIEVGGEAAAVASAAYRAALDYSKERLQMRHWDRAAPSGNAQVPIIEHPDVRRMLLSSASYVQAMRGLLLLTTSSIDRSHLAQGDERERLKGLVELLTPICKAWCSDWGFRVTEWAVQIYGGYGYTTDYPVEQYLRDIKITSIYEGTNGIQALDFVGRKLPANGGAAARELLGMARETAKECSGDEALAGSAAILDEAIGQIETLLMELAGHQDQKLLTMLNAVPILDIFGTVLGGYILLDQARLARRRLGELTAAKGVDNSDAIALRQFLLDNPEAAFYHDKTQAAIHFAHRALPTVAAQAVAIGRADRSAMDAVL